MEPPPIEADSPATLSRRSALAWSGALLASGLVARASQPTEPPQAGARNQTVDDAGPASPTLVVFVLRHAEPTGTTSGDPGLTEAGRERAERVGAMLRSVGVVRALHTPALRARQTAEGIARVCACGTGSYDPANPAGITRKLIEGGGVWALVGHSNTVPDLVRRLGGDPGTDLIAPDTYDDVFMIARAGGTLSMRLHS